MKNRNVSDLYLETPKYDRGELWKRSLALEGYPGMHRISTDRLAKSGNFDPFWEDDIIKKYISTLENNHKIMQYAIKNGVSVPISEGVFRVSLQTSLLRFLLNMPEQRIAQVVEFIPGFAMRSLGRAGYSNSEISRIFALRDKEIVKARMVGIEPEDSEDGQNAIYMPKEDKIFLVDVDKWKMSH